MPPVDSCRDEVGVDFVFTQDFRAHYALGRDPEVEPLLKRSLAIKEKAPRREQGKE